MNLLFRETTVYLATSVKFLPCTVKERARPSSPTSVNDLSFVLVSDSCCGLVPEGKLAIVDLSGN